jgi:hypothetical protein
LVTPRRLTASPALPDSASDKAADPAIAAS